MSLCVDSLDICLWYFINVWYFFILKRLSPPMKMIFMIKDRGSKICDQGTNPVPWKLFVVCFSIINVHVPIWWRNQTRSVFCQHRQHYLYWYILMLDTGEIIRSYNFIKTVSQCQFVCNIVKNLHNSIRPSRYRSIFCKILYDLHVIGALSFAKYISLPTLC